MSVFIRNNKTLDVFKGPYVRMANARNALANLDRSEYHIYDDNWRARERDRTTLIDMTKFKLEPISDHYLHISTRDTGEGVLLVSYTENDDKGGRDRQVPGKRVGSYLTEFYKHLSSDDVTRLSGEITSAARGTNVLIARTAAEIEQVYTDTTYVSSCMGYGRSHFRLGNVHPTAAYGDSDVVVMYLKNRSGNVIARTVAWPDRKIYSTIYGDSSKLRPLLTAMGYESGNLSGAKLSFVRTTREASRNSIVVAMPYIDSPRYVRLDTSGEEPYFVITASGSGDNTQPSNAEGYLAITATQCPILGLCIGHQQTTPVTNAQTGETISVTNKGMKANPSMFFTFEKVIYFIPKDFEMQFTDLVSGERVPTIWVAKNTEVCIHTGQRDRRDKMVRLPLNWGYCVTAEFFTRYNSCQATNATYKKEDLIWVEHGAYWSREWAQKFDQVVERDGKYYAKSLVEA